MQECNLSNKTKLRCEKLHKVGLEMFLKHGYQKTSLNDIVKVAGGSLSTVYKHYGNKREFFEAVVFLAIDGFFDEIEQKLNLKKDISVEEFLFEFGRLYIDIFETNLAIGISKIMYSEGVYDNIVIANNFKQKVENVVGKIFQDFFGKQEHQKKLLHVSIEDLAERFCVLIREPEFSISITANKVVKLTNEEKDKKVQKIVELFLHGYIQER